MLEETRPLLRIVYLKCMEQGQVITNLFLQAYDTNSANFSSSTRRIMIAIYAVVKKLVRLEVKHFYITF